MALSTPILLGNSTAIDTSSPVEVTLSRAITPGAFVFAVVMLGRDNATNSQQPTSIAGGGVTWTLEEAFNHDTTGNTRGALYIYRAVATSPSGTTVTVTPAGTEGGIIVAVVEWEGVDTGGTNGSNAFHPTNRVGSATTNTTMPAAMQTLASVENAFFGICYTSGPNPNIYTPDSSPAMIELLEVNTALNAGSKRKSLFFQYGIGIVDANPTINANTGSYDAGAFWVLEIVAAIIANAGKPGLFRGTGGTPLTLVNVPNVGSPIIIL